MNVISKPIYQHALVTRFSGNFKNLTFREEVSAERPVITPVPYETLRAKLQQISAQFKAHIILNAPKQEVSILMDGQCETVDLWSPDLPGTITTPKNSLVDNEIKAELARHCLKEGRDYTYTA